jgi:hypothetical protein
MHTLSFLIKFKVSFLFKYTFLIKFKVSFLFKYIHSNSNLTFKLTFKPNIQINTQFSHKKILSFSCFFSSLLLPLIPSFLLASVVRMPRAGDGTSGHWGCGAEAPMKGASRVVAMTARTPGHRGAEASTEASGGGDNIATVVRAAKRL